MYKLVRPFLFLQDSEKIHDRMIHLGKLMRFFPFKQAASLLYKFERPELEREVMGLKFKNPVGLAAGFDKGAKILPFWPAIGFGFIEIGTVTPKPQAGNPKPRLFRLVEDEAVINRMGFNNEGIDVIVERVKKNRSKGLIIGGNIGKNKVTPNEEAVKDYEICFEKLYPHVDYFVVNVSSPNTPGLRELQDKKPLMKILKALKDKEEALAKKNSVSIRPILLKIAPDLTSGQVDDIVDVVKQSQITGVIATNTTNSRDELKTNKERIEEIANGGLSGKPLRKRSTEFIKMLRKGLGPEPVIIGVGGIDSAKTAQEKLKAGANLVQVYTGLVFKGPGLVKQIKKGL